MPNADIEPAHSQPGPRHQFNDPLRVVAFNTLEHWAKDVSEDIAAEIQTRLDMEGNELPEHIRDFVESHRHSSAPAKSTFGVMPRLGRRGRQTGLASLT